MKRYTVTSLMSGKTFSVMASNKKQAKEIAKAFVANKFYFSVDLVLSGLDLEYDMNHKLCENM